MSLLCVLLLSAFSFAAAARGGTLEDAARALAREVAAIPGVKEAVTLRWEGGAPLSPSQSETLRRAFAAELKGAGVTVAENAAPTALRVSLRETPVRLLLIAEAMGGAEAQNASAEPVRIVELPRASLSAHDGEGSPVEMQKELLWKQREPLLDAVERNSAQSRQPLLLLLNRNALAIYRSEKNGWVLQNSLAIPAENGTKRDERGAIEFPWDGEDRVRIEMGGKTCTGELPETPRWDCSPANKLDVEERIATGSCDNRTWSLSSDDHDWSMPDRLLLKDASLGADAPAAAELQMPGPILAISGGSPAHAVIFNLLTGEYEAYRIHMACGN